MLIGTPTAQKPNVTILTGGHPQSLITARKKGNAQVGFLGEISVWSILNASERTLIADFFRKYLKG